VNLWDFLSVDTVVGPNKLYFPCPFLQGNGEEGVKNSRVMHTRNSELLKNLFFIHSCFTLLKTEALSLILILHPTVPVYDIFHGHMASKTAIFGLVSQNKVITKVHISYVALKVRKD
jgi:hypothetical protein